MVGCVSGVALAGEPASNSGDAAAETRSRRSAAQADSSSTSRSPGTPEQKDPTPVVRLPAYHNLRFEEDWSGLPDEKRQGWDALKRLSLDAGGRVRLSLGGQLRARAEWWDAFAFSPASGAEDAFGLLRLRLHGDLSLGPYVRVFAEGQSALANGRSLPGGNRTLDTDSAELQNALLDLRVPLDDNTSLTFRVGRQELQFGRQRLVSPLDWSNTRPRSFDGFRGILRTGRWRVDGFWTRWVRTRKYHFNNHDSGTDLYGLYAVGPLASSGWSLDVYWLGLDANSRAYPGGSGSERRQTAGARLSRPGSRYDLDLESSGQWGSLGNRDIRAWMLALEGGVRFPARRFSPRLHLGLDYASGDDDRSDDRLGTFNQLFPLGHAYFGFADFVGRQNILDFSQGVTLQPARGVTGKLTQHWFRRAEPQDALYNAGGGIVRTGPHAPRRVGSELDLNLTWKVNRHLNAEGGYSRFFAGPFLTATGPSEDLSFGYLSLQWTF